MRKSLTVVALTLSLSVPISAVADSFDRESPRHGPIDRIIQVIKHLVRVLDDLPIPPRP